MLTPPLPSDGDDLLEGWAAIARFLGVEIRAAQLRASWARPLPIWKGHDGVVFAFKSDLRYWMRSHVMAYERARELAKGRALARQDESVHVAVEKRRTSAT